MPEKLQRAQEKSMKKAAEAAVGLQVVEVNAEQLGQYAAAHQVYHNARLGQMEKIEETLDALQKKFVELAPLKREQLQKLYDLDVAAVRNDAQLKEMRAELRELEDDSPAKLQLAEEIAVLQAKQDQVAELFTETKVGVSDDLIAKARVLLSAQDKNRYLLGVLENASSYIKSPLQDDLILKALKESDQAGDKVRKTFDVAKLEREFASEVADLMAPLKLQLETGLAAVDAGLVLLNVELSANKLALTALEVEVRQKQRALLKLFDEDIAGLDPFLSPAERNLEIEKFAPGVDTLLIEQALEEIARLRAADNDEVKQEIIDEKIAQYKAKGLAQELIAVKMEKLSNYLAQDDLENDGELILELVDLSAFHPGLVDSIKLAQRQVEAQALLVDVAGKVKVALADEQEQVTEHGAAAILHGEESFAKMNEQLFVLQGSPHFSEKLADLIVAHTNLVTKIKASDMGFVVSLAALGQGNKGLRATYEQDPKEAVSQAFGQIREYSKETEEALDNVHDLIRGEMKALGVNIGKISALEKKANKLEQEITVLTLQLTTREYQLGILLGSKIGDHEWGNLNDQLQACLTERGKISVQMNKLAGVLSPAVVRAKVDLYNNLTLLKNEVDVGRKLLNSKVKKGASLEEISLELRNVTELVSKVSAAADDYKLDFAEGLDAVQAKTTAFRSSIENAQYLSSLSNLNDYVRLTSGRDAGDIFIADLSDVRVVGQNLRYADISGSRIKGTAFEDCNMDLVVACETDLSQSVFRRTRVDGMDVRGSNVLGMRFKQDSDAEYIPGKMKFSFADPTNVNANIDRRYAENVVARQLDAISAQTVKDNTPSMIGGGFRWLVGAKPKDKIEIKVTQADIEGYVAALEDNDALTFLQFMSSDKRNLSTLDVTFDLSLADPRELDFDSEQFKGCKFKYRPATGPGFDVHLGGIMEDSVLDPTYVVGSTSLERNQQIHRFGFDKNTMTEYLVKLQAHPDLNFVDYIRQEYVSNGGLLEPNTRVVPCLKSGGDVDLTGFDFGNGNFSNCDFAGAILTNSHSNGAQFVGSCFEAALFKDCAYTNTNFSRSNMFGAVFNTAIGAGCSFERSNIPEAIILKLDVQGLGDQRVNMNGTNLSGASGALMRLVNVDANHLNLDHSTIAHIEFRKVKAKGMRLENVAAESIAVIESELTKTIMSSAQIKSLETLDSIVEMIGQNVEITKLISDRCVLSGNIQDLTADKLDIRGGEVTNLIIDNLAARALEIIDVEAANFKIIGTKKQLKELIVRQMKGEGMTVSDADIHHLVFDGVNADKLQIARVKAVILELTNVVVKELDLQDSKIKQAILNNVKADKTSTLGLQMYVVEAENVDLGLLEGNGRVDGAIAGIKGQDASGRTLEQIEADHLKIDKLEQHWLKNNPLLQITLAGFKGGFDKTALWGYDQEKSMGNSIFSAKTMLIALTVIAIAATFVGMAFLGFGIPAIAAACVVTAGVAAYAGYKAGDLLNFTKGTAISGALTSGLAVGAAVLVGGPLLVVGSIGFLCGCGLEKAGIIKPGSVAHAFAQSCEFVSHRILEPLMITLEEKALLQARAGERIATDQRLELAAIEVLQGQRERSGIIDIVARDLELEASQFASAGVAVTVKPDLAHPLALDAIRHHQQFEQGMDLSAVREAGIGLLPHVGVVEHREIGQYDVRSVVPVAVLPSQEAALVAK